MIQAAPLPLNGLIEQGVKSFGSVQVELNHKTQTAKIAGRKFSLEQVNRILSQLEQYGYRVKRRHSLFGLGAIEYATVIRH